MKWSRSVRVHDCIRRSRLHNEVDECMVRVLRKLRYEGRKLTTLRHAFMWNVDRHKCEGEVFVRHLRKLKIVRTSFVDGLSVRNYILIFRVDNIYAVTNSLSRRFPFCECCNAFSSLLNSILLRGSRKPFFICVNIGYVKSMYS